MNVDLSVFMFTTDCKSVVRETDYVAHVPANVTQVKDLFAVLQRELQLPDYFGNNWNALDECLRDLSWINARRVVILHKDLPLADERSQRIHLESLIFAIKDWKAEVVQQATGATPLPWPTHELLVIFPPEVREQIASRLQHSDISQAFE